MDPMTLMLLSSIPSLLKSGTGIYDLIQSSKYAKTERPAYEIPESLKQMLASAQGQASQIQLPGQSLIEQQIGGATSKGMTAAREATDSPAALLGQLAQLTGSEQDKYKDLGIAAAQNWTSNQDVLRNALGTMAGEEKAQWQWDKGEPYLNAMEAAAKLQETGQKNLFGGLTDVGNIGMQTYFNNELLNLMGDKNKTNNDLLDRINLKNKASSSYNWDYQNPVKNKNNYLLDSLYLYNNIG